MRMLQGSAGNAAVHRWVAAAAPPAQPTVARLVSTDLNEMAEAGEANAASEMARAPAPPISRVSNVTDVESARKLVSDIEGYRANMQEGAGAGGAFTVSEQRVTPDKMAANERAISQIDDYLVTAGEQTRTLGSFQDAMSKARVDYERLKAQVTHLTVTNQIAGGTAGEMGSQIVESAGLGDPEAARAHMQGLAANPALETVRRQTQEAHDQMNTAGQAVGAKQTVVSTSAYTYMEKLNEFKTGIPSVNTNPDQAKELSELKEKIENVKKYVGKGLEYAGKALGAAGVPGAEKVGEHAQPAVDWLTDQFYDAELNGINSKITQYNAAHTEHQITANLDAVRAASRAFTGAITDFKNAVEAFAHAQLTFRDSLRGFGAAADRSGGGDHYARVASVLAEVDTYETQLDDALRLGYQEQTAAHEAAGARHTVEGGPGAAGAPRDAGATYYEPYRTFHSNGGWGYQCMRQEVSFHSYGTSRGSASGAANVGVNATVDEAITMLQGYRNEIEPMRHALATAMNLRMDSAMPTSAGGPAPTARGANTGL